MNDSVDYRLVEEIFLEAVELTSSERTALLAERCGPDLGLRDEVEALLSAHEGPGVVPGMADERPFGGRFPERIGEYRIVRPLGEGGMGVVLLAIREGPGFEQTVALKLLRGRLPDPMLARRLEEERRILARLEHSGIARFVDGGVTGAGEPYYAMEYVHGDDILSYCDDHRLGIDDRLRLFADVCDAVHYAHQQLVVHRDLKPSNIFVTPEGRAKLLDFGIAKSLEGVTGTEQTAKWITTAYASPEQVKGEPASTLSDVYALGVLLCEVLSGYRPYSTASRSLEELTRVIVHEPPRKPSHLAERGLPTDPEAGRRAVDPEEVARRRRATPGRLARALRGDLDLIVSKALAKDPERRYDSARDLGDDLRRFLDGRPLRARPDSAGYRFAKFYGRHRALVGAAAVLALALVGGAVGIAWQAGLARAQRDRAETEAARARQVTALMTDIFRLGDPTRTLGDTVGVRQVLQEGVARVEDTLNDDPVLQATLLLELGKIHRNLGLLTEAERLVGRALSVREAHEPGSLAYAEALGVQGLVLRDAGRPREAIRGLEGAVELRDRLLPRPDTTQAGLLASLGWEVRAAGDYERARSLFERALEIQRNRLGETHPAVATSMLGLASTFHDQGHFDQAEELFRTALGGGDPEASPVAATALVNLGMIERLREQYREAEPILRAGLRMRLTLFGPQHPDVVEAREQLGIELLALGRYREADSLLTENLGIAVMTLGEAHVRTRGAREALASLDHDLGRYDLAAARVDSVVQAKMLAHEGDHPGVVYSLNEGGDVLLDAGRLDEAEARYRESLEMGARLGGNDGVYGALARNGLARVALRRGDLQLADSLSRVALSLASGSLREDHRYVLDMERTRARMLLALDRVDDARSVLSRVLEAEIRARPSPHPRIGETLALIGEAADMAGDTIGALDAWRRASAEYAELPPDHPKRRSVEAALAAHPDEPIRGPTAPQSPKGP